MNRSSSGWEPIPPGDSVNVESTDEKPEKNGDPKNGDALSADDVFTSDDEVDLDRSVGNLDQSAGVVEASSNGCNKSSSSASDGAQQEIGADRKTNQADNDLGLFLYSSVIMDQRCPEQGDSNVCGRTIDDRPFSESKDYFDDQDYQDTHGVTASKDVDEQGPHGVSDPKGGGASSAYSEAPSSGPPPADSDATPPSSLPEQCAEGNNTAQGAEGPDGECSEGNNTPQGAEGSDGLKTAPEKAGSLEGKNSQDNAADENLGASEDKHSQDEASAPSPDNELECMKAEVDQLVDALERLLPSSSKHNAQLKHMLNTLKLLIPPVRATNSVVMPLWYGMLDLAMQNRACTLLYYILLIVISVSDALCIICFGLLALACIYAVKFVCCTRHVLLRTLVWSKQHWRGLLLSMAALVGIIVSVLFVAHIATTRTNPPIIHTGTYSDLYPAHLTASNASEMLAVSFDKPQYGLAYAEDRVSRVTFSCDVSNITIAFKFMSCELNLPKGIVLNIEVPSILYSLWHECEDLTTAFKSMLRLITSGVLVQGPSNHSVVVSGWQYNAMAEYENIPQFLGVLAKALPVNAVSSGYGPKLPVTCTVQSLVDYISPPIVNAPPYVYGAVVLLLCVAAFLRFVNLNQLRQAGGAIVSFVKQSSATIGAALALWTRRAADFGSRVIRNVWVQGSLLVVGGYALGALPFWLGGYEFSSEDAR